MIKLSVVACATILGCIWSFLILILGIAAQYSQKCASVVKLFSQVYIGYRETLSGIMIGAVYAFGDGFISGTIAAWVYNMIMF